MPPLSLTDHIGEIRHVPSDQVSRGAAGGWWVVDHIDGRKLMGLCIVEADNDPQRWKVGDFHDVGQCDVVPDDQVSEEIWVTLARVRLMLCR